MKKIIMMLVTVMLGVTAAAAHTAADELKGATGNPDKAGSASIPVPEVAEIKIDTPAPAGIQRFIMEPGDAHIQSFFEERHQDGEVDDAERRAQRHYARNEVAHQEIGRKGSEHHGKVRRHARREAGKDGNGHNHGKVRRHARREAEKNRNGHSETSARKSHGHVD